MGSIPTTGEKAYEIEFSNDTATGIPYSRMFKILRKDDKKVFAGYFSQIKNSFPLD